MPIWKRWKAELPLLAEHPVPRRFSEEPAAIIDVQLHGFSAASQAAYGGVVYICYMHADTSVSVSLVASKARVAPLTNLTIPRLELCGALMLAKLLVATAKDLDVPLSQVYSWSDSAIVLHWINSASTRLKTYVVNRVNEISKLVPPDQWRYVATSYNPADHVSRGLSPKALLKCQLWWKGPDWLRQPQDAWPRRPDINLGREIPEMKAIVLNIRPPPDNTIWEKYSSFDHLLRVIRWCRHSSTMQGRSLEKKPSGSQMWN